MGNKNNGSDRLKKELENRNFKIKNLVNYYPKICLTYIGSKNHTFFIVDRYKCLNIACVIKPIHSIIVQQQFSLNGQLKVLKKWCVDFVHIAFMNKSHEFVVLCHREIQKWEINSCYNLINCFKIYLFNLSMRDFPLLFLYSDYFHMNLAFEQEQIFFSQKDMEVWNLIEKRYIDLMKFQLNELGNILILVLGKHNGDDSNFCFYLKIYIKNAFGKWRIIKEIETVQDNFYYCFLDNEKFVALIKNIITIWQIMSQKSEVAQLQQLKLDLKPGNELYGLHYMNSLKLLIVQTSFAIYFLKTKNEKFYFTQYIEIYKELLIGNPEGFLFNFQNIFDNQNRPWQIGILKIHEN